MSEQNGERKFYTFMNMKKCVGKEGRTYTGVTMEALVNSERVRFECAPSGQRVANFSTPISNRGKAIGTMCGTAPHESKEGTVWASIALWDMNAERFEKFIASHPHCAIILTGSIRVEENQSKRDGNFYKNVKINADDFTLLRDIKPVSQDEPVGAHTAEPYGSGSSDTYPASPSFVGNSAFTDIYDDDELPF